MKDTIQKIEIWAENRNLIDGATQSAQYEKLLEEIGELGRALIEDCDADVADAIGDCVVVLTILAKQRFGQDGGNIESCVDAAYSEIKDRTGKMVNGVFVKDVA